jgi:hypothetical protein
MVLLNLNSSLFLLEFKLAVTHRADAARHSEELLKALAAHAMCKHGHVYGHMLTCATGLQSTRVCVCVCVCMCVCLCVCACVFVCGGGGEGVRLRVRNDVVMFYDSAHMQILCETSK